MLFAITGSVFGQEYHEYSAYDLFKRSAGATWNGTENDFAGDSTTNTANGYYELETSASADTIISFKLNLERGGNDITVHVLADSVSATTNVRSAIYFGNYRGPELGWNWTLMDSIVADAGTITYNVASVDLGKYEVLQTIGIKITEMLAAKVQYAIRIKHFRWR
jgi:hypothetical protein